MDGKVQADALFVGLTRAPSLFGVSYMFALMNFFLCMMTYVITSNGYFLFSMFPIHGIGYYLCSKEPLFIELFMVKTRLCSRAKNKFYHRGNSYDPY